MPPRTPAMFGVGPSYRDEEADALRLSEHLQSLRVDEAPVEAAPSMDFTSNPEALAVTTPAPLSAKDRLGEYLERVRSGKIEQEASMRKAQERADWMSRLSGASRVGHSIAAAFNPLNPKADYSNANALDAEGQKELDMAKMGSATANANNKEEFGAMRYGSALDTEAATHEFNTRKLAVGEARARVEMEAKLSRESQMNDQRERFHSDDMDIRRQNAASARLAAGTRIDLKAGEDDQKRLDKMDALSVEEHAFRTDAVDGHPILPSSQSAEKFKKGYSSYQKLVRLADKYEQAVAAAGPGAAVTPGTDVRADLQAMEQQMLVEAKNVGELGQLTAGDMSIVNPMIPNETNILTGQGPKLAGQNPAAARLKSLRRWADIQLESGRNAYGYQAGKGPAAGTPKTAGQGRTETGRQYSPSRNSTRITYSDGTNEVVDGRP